jgi:OFA family oxalate/formate antiporter-like MFS transporter
MEISKSIATDTKSNFGKKGWGVVIFCAIMLFFCTGMTTDGQNLTVPGIAALHNWDYATLLSFGTGSGLISIVGMFVFGWICHKKGARFTVVLALIAGGLSYIWYGNVQSVTQYVIALCLISTFGNVFAWIAGGAYLAMWFPRKKGLALGWATMGNNFASAFYVPIMALVASKIGLPMGITVFGIVVCFTALLALKFPNTPEKGGGTPDNVPMSPEEIETYRKNSDAYVSPWTFAKLFKTKELWLISLGLGMYMLVTVGVMSQLVPRMMSLGFDQNKAIFSMSVCAIIGVVGSYLWGVIDQKLSTRIATALYGVWYALAVVFNIIPNIVCLYISIFMIGIAIGGNANWPVSLTSTVFGHKNFAKIYTLVNPFISIIRFCAFVVLAASIRITGSMTSAYIVFVILAFVGAGLILLVNDKKYNDAA